MTRLKQLIDKWKADLICINNEYELAFEYGATIAASDFNGRRNQLKACISEAEQLLQEPADTVKGEKRKDDAWGDLGDTLYEMGNEEPGW